MAINSQCHPWPGEYPGCLSILTNHFNTHFDPAMNRNDMLVQLQQTSEWDIVIIGGGATGLGCAVDAASRGLTTLLIEQYDFAKGTSSRSTKLVHGGVRYLAQGNIKLVMEALRERAYLLRNAPHVTSVMAFVVPVYSLFDKWFYGIGLKVYDLLSGRLSLGKTKWLSKRETLQQLTGINGKTLKGGILYYDGQFDDARLAVDLAKTAASQGACLLNYAKALSFTKNNNRITGIDIRDEINGVVYPVSAKVVVNATGVFADRVMQLDEPRQGNIIAPSQGVHIVVDASFFPNATALMIPKTDDGRVLFAVPWHGKVLLGTTDTPLKQIAIEPTALEEEIDYLLHHANRYLSCNITRTDICSVFAGLRPLIRRTGARTTSLLSRDHTILLSGSGLVTVSGGKWTTYRKMAEDVISKAMEVAHLPKASCVTKRLPIRQTVIHHNNNNGKDGLYPGFPYTREDIDVFVTEEMAMTTEDILARRTRTLFLDARLAITVAPLVSRQVAFALEKDEEWIQADVAAFVQLAQQYCLA